jgi:hypothetical protein
MTGQEQMQGVISALFDFSFATFTAKRLIPILYGLGLVVTGIYAIGALWMAIQSGGAFALGMLIMIPLVYLLGVVSMRVFMEAVMAVFRIAENTERPRM